MTGKSKSPDSAIKTERRLVRFGLVGCGNIGAKADDKARQFPDAHLWFPYSHAGAIAASPMAELAAVCDVNESNMRLAADRFNVSPRYTDYREMIDKENLDAISVATRTAERSDVIAYAVQKGIRAVYCEKPLSTTLEEADRLESLLVKNKVAFLYGVKRRFMPVYQRARERVDAGDIGQLKTIIVRFGYAQLFWAHPHSVDIACFMVHDQAWDYVQADLEMDPSCVQKLTVDTDPLIRLATIRFKSGVMAHIVAGDGYDLELCGTNGMLSVRSDGRSTHRRLRAEGGQDYGVLLAESLDPTQGPSSGTLNSITALSESVLDNTDPGYGIQQAVRNQEILFGFVYSALQNGERIPAPIERKGMKITGRTGSLYA